MSPSPQIATAPDSVVVPPSDAVASYWTPAHAEFAELYERFRPWTMTAFVEATGLNRSMIVGWLRVAQGLEPYSSRAGRRPPSPEVLAAVKDLWRVTFSRAAP